jgi:hypothetical protein
MILGVSTWFNAEVIDQIAEREGYKILLLEEEKRNWNLRLISTWKPNVVNMAGKIKFQQELELISNLDIMLYGFGQHIAAMLGINVITLWALRLLCRFTI